MKKTLLALNLVAVSLLPMTASGQNQRQIEPQVQTSPMVSFRQLMQDPAYSRMFTYNMLPVIKNEPEPKGNETIEFFRNELKPAIEAGNLQAAISMIETRVQGQQDPEALLLGTLGNLYWAISEEQGRNSTRDKERAIQYFERALDKFPNYLRAHKALAQIYVQLGREEQAIPHFHDAIRLGDNDSTTFGVLGYIYLNMENPKTVAAESALRKALIMDPDNKNYRALLGQALNLQERWEEAAAFFGQLIEENPNDPQFWIAQANALLAQEKIAEAATNLEVVRAMGEADAQSLNLLGNIYIAREMLDMATDAFLTAVETGKAADPASIINAVNTLASYGSYNNALQLIEALRQNYGEDLSQDQEINLLATEAEIMMNTDEEEKAAETLQEILEIRPMHGDALITLANYFGGQGENIDKAIMYFKRAESLTDPDIQRKAFLRHAQLLVRQKEYGEAVDLLESALALEPDKNVETYLESVRNAYRAQQARG